MVKQYKSYKDVPKKYKYDLEFLLENKTKEKVLEDVLKTFDQLIKIKNSKYDSKEAYLESLKLSDQFAIKSNKLFNYITNSISVNIVDNKMNSFFEKVKFEFYKKTQEFGPEEARFFKNSSKIAKWAKTKEFLVYKKNLLGQLENKKHQLSKAIQEFRQKESRADISASSVFEILTNSEIDFGFATNSKGKKIKVTNANKLILSKHKDKKVRKTSSIAYRNGYLKHQHSLSNLLYQHFKKTTVWSSIRKFNSTIEFLLHSDRVSEKMLLTLYSAIEKSKKPLVQFRKNWKKFYKAKFGERPTKYDYNVDLITLKNKYTPKESMKKVLKSLEFFGEEYTRILKKAFSDNWIDFMPVKNKRTGAYSIGQTYGIKKKLLFMNFDGTFRSVETLAHEIGHSMHSYFSDKHQEQINSQYPIFLAEIASIFNELMLHDYVLKTSKDDKLKFYIYEKMILGFMGTVLRQIEWSNFEYDMYKLIEKGIPVSSYEKIAKVYYDNSQKYALRKSKFNLKNSFYGILVPHFYYDFYVYKYAIGQICAMIFFEKYKQEGPKALQFYIEKFLSAGNKDWPLETLKKAGIDLTKRQTYDKSFKILKKYVNQWIKIGNKIFKTK